MHNCKCVRSGPVKEVAWSLWMVRNQLIFQQKELNISDVCFSIRWQLCINSCNFSIVSKIKFSDQGLWAAQNAWGGAWCSEWVVGWLCCMSFSACIFVSVATQWRSKRLKKLWISTFFVVAWRIWMVRNEIIFHQKELNFEEVGHSVKWEVAMWTKA